MTDFVKAGNNQAIIFTGDDIGGDQVMIITMLYIVMAILAFIFGVTTRNTIEREAGTIGTLPRRAGAALYDSAVAGHVIFGGDRQCARLYTL